MANRANDAKPKPKRAIPKPPSHLRPQARDAWATVTKLLDETQVLTVSDEMALVGLCESYADLMRARGQLPADGSLTYSVVTKSGGLMLRARPEVAIAADADRRFAMWLTKFGLRPLTVHAFLPLSARSPMTSTSSG